MINISEIALWLRSSIPGIIILGALGSILALILLKILRLVVDSLVAFFTRVLPTQSKRAIEWFTERLIEIAKKLAYSFGHEFGRMSVGDPRGEVAFFAVQ